MALVWFNQGVWEPYALTAVPPAQASAADQSQAAGRAAASDKPTTPVALRPTSPTDTAARLAALRVGEQHAPPRFSEEHFKKLRESASADRRAPAPPEPALTVKQIMSAPVIVGHAEDSLDRAWRLLVDNSVRHLPIVDDSDGLIGIVSDRDLRRLVPLEAFPSSLLHPVKARNVAAIMATCLLTVRPHTSIREAAGVMVREGIHALPVVDPIGRVSGIVTSSDLLRCMVTETGLDLWL
jgi:CBS domain-containing protein